MFSFKILCIKNGFRNFEKMIPMSLNGINQFMSSFCILYPLKTPKNLLFSVFLRVEFKIEILARNCLIFGDFRNIRMAGVVI